MEKENSTIDESKIQNVFNLDNNQQHHDVHSPVAISSTSSVSISHCDNNIANLQASHNNDKKMSLSTSNVTEILQSNDCTGIEIKHSKIIDKNNKTSERVKRHRSSLTKEKKLEINNLAKIRMRNYRANLTDEKKAKINELGREKKKCYRTKLRKQKDSECCNAQVDKSLMSSMPSTIDESKIQNVFDLDNNQQHHHVHSPIVMSSTSSVSISHCDNNIGNLQASHDNDKTMSLSTSNDTEISESNDCTGIEKKHSKIIDKNNKTSERVKRHRSSLTKEKKMEINNLAKIRMRNYRANLTDEKKAKINELGREKKKCYRTKLRKKKDSECCNAQVDKSLMSSMPSTIDVSKIQNVFNLDNNQQHHHVHSPVVMFSTSSASISHCDNNIGNLQASHDNDTKISLSTSNDTEILQSNDSTGIEIKHSKIIDKNNKISERVKRHRSRLTKEKKMEINNLAKIRMRNYRANLTDEKKAKINELGREKKKCYRTKLRKKNDSECSNAQVDNSLMSFMPSTSFQNVSPLKNLKLNIEHSNTVDNSTICNDSKAENENFNHLKKHKPQAIKRITSNTSIIDGTKRFKLINEVFIDNKTNKSKCMISARKNKGSTAVVQSNLLHSMKLDKNHEDDVHITMPSSMSFASVSDIKITTSNSSERVKRYRVREEKRAKNDQLVMNEMKCDQTNLNNKNDFQKVEEYNCNASFENFSDNSMPSTSYQTVSNYQNIQQDYEHCIEGDDSVDLNILLQQNESEDKQVKQSITRKANKRKNTNIPRPTMRIKKPRRLLHTIDEIEKKKNLTRERVKRHRAQKKQQNIEEELEYIKMTGENELNISRNELMCNNIHIPTYTEDYLGKMSFKCISCKAKHFEDEQVGKNCGSFNDCCSHGGVKLEKLDYPTQLKHLLDGSHKESKHFQKNIRCYNNSFAFASFNANVIHFSGRRRGPYCFKIQGQIYYQMNNALYPESGEDPSYGQLFIYDPDDAINYRINKNERLHRDVLREIEGVMRTHNVFTKSFNMMKEVLEIEEALAKEKDEEIPELQLLFTLKKGMDPGRFNFQRVSEVAAIFNTNSDGEIPESYVTLYNKANKELQLVSSLDPSVEAFIYPIFHPFGDRGYRIGMIRSDEDKRLKKKNISRAEYLKYKMAIRENVFNQFLYGGRLFQQWLVDNYVKVEKDRLQYCANHQTELRSDTYKGLIDHINNAAQKNKTSVGKLVILPSTFIGSPRNMMQQYQDAMAIVCKHGKPDLFITMTCNPQWKEIVENLLPNQTVSDRPDIVARVFSLKVNRLMKLIIKKKCFGDVRSYVSVIEFQKRGLPHIHLLVILNSDSKILSPESVDRYISAEIPERNVNSTLHEIIMTNNIHGPCADWCLVDGKCSKNFPKNLQDETIMEDNCYVSYRRRNADTTYEMSNGYVVDNRFVVPYCPKLSQTFNCHINVEVVSSIKSVKYIYKYIYKGHDSASIIITNSNGETTINHNEINHYEENRYVGPVEAAWRILSKPLSKRSHSVCRLPVHLPNEQNILIRQGRSDNEISFDLKKNTKLLDYFNLNVRDINARKYFYTQIPEYYSWDKKQCKWYKRGRKENVVGRMYSVSPCDIELFHLRLLLLTVKGAISFQTLKTVNGVTHETFTSTCLVLGLIENDNEWKETLQEATVWMMPQSLRRLFVRILIHCHPLNAGELWEQFKTSMSEDYHKQFANHLAEQKAYMNIKKLLFEEGYDFGDFPGLPTIEDKCSHSEIVDFVNVNEEKKLGIEKYDKLNIKQKDIVDFVLNILNDNSDNICRCLYVDGPGGSGKTFLYVTLWHLLRSEGKKVCNIAFTGIAATLLPMGKTVHKVFGLPVPLYSDSSSSIKSQSTQGLYLKDVDVFIWDEAPMSPRYALEIMDRTLRDIMQIDVPFGGKIIILGGDFRQILPIKERGTRSEIINLSIKNCKLWKYFTKFTLSENMRALPEETEFIEFLLQIGNGILNDEKDYIQLPQKIIQEEKKDIVQDMYENLIKEKRFKELALCAILAPRNIDVDEINNRVVQLLDSDREKVFHSIDCIDNGDDINEHEVILPEYLNTLSPPGLPPHILHLRINSVVMLIRNLSINEGLCNGTRLLVLDLLNNVIKCQILSGDKCGNVVFIHRVLLYCENIYPFTFKRKQFPIKIAFAMTINKSQGQTFNRIAIDLRKDVFNHGQLYVALSRVRSFDSVKVYLGNQRSGNCVKNYVYKEIFE